MVKNLLSNAGIVGLILYQGTNITHAAGQLSPNAMTRETTCSRSCALQQEKSLLHSKRSLCSTRENVYNKKRISTAKNINSYFPVILKARKPRSRSCRDGFSLFGLQTWWKERSSKLPSTLLLIRALSL